MKRALAILLLLLLAVSASAQDRRIVVRSLKQIIDARVSTGSRTDNNGKFAALIRIPTSDSLSLHFKQQQTVGSPYYSEGEWLVFVSVDTPAIDLILDGCKPLSYVFREPLIPRMGYKMDMVVETDRYHALIAPFFSYNQSQLAGGLMLGFCKNHGFYVRAKTDFNFNHLDYPIVCDEEGYVGEYRVWLTGDVQKARLAFTGGYLCRLYSDVLYVFVGGGYGLRTLSWERVLDNDRKGNEYIKVAPYSFRGLELETGLVFRWKGMVLSLGVQTNADRFKYYEVNLGIGWMP